MKIKCRHGYFNFQETAPGEASRFVSLFGLALSPTAEGYTFDSLTAAPDYAIVGGTYLDAACTETFEGEPWDVMRANRLVFDFILNLVVPIDTVTQVIEVETADNYFISDGLILPGSVTEDGSRVTDYSAWFSFDSMRFRYSELSYE